MYTVPPASDADCLGAGFTDQRSNIVFPLPHNPTHAFPPGLSHTAPFLSLPTSNGLATPVATNSFVFNTQLTPTLHFAQGYNGTELGDILRRHTQSVQPSPPLPNNTFFGHASARGTTELAAPATTFSSAQTIRSLASQAITPQTVQPSPSPATGVTVLPATRTTTPPATQTTTPPAVPTTATPTAPSPATGGADEAPTNPPADAQLIQENESTWRARNPGRPNIPVRQVKKLTQEEKAAQSAARQKTAEKREALETALRDHLADTNARLEALAEQHEVTLKYVTGLCTTLSGYHKQRKPQLKNALVHAKAVEVNKDRAPGERYCLAEITAMVKEDPKMQDLTHEEEEDYVKALAEWRETKVHGVRANNAAVAQDVFATTHRITRELDSLRDRTGIYATVFVTCGHINDTTQTTWYGTDNSANFWEDVFKHSAGDVARQYEQWACAQGKNLEERDSLATVRKQVTAEIITGLKNVTGKREIAMNYTNYNTSIVATYGIQLVGWPSSVPFTNPSKIGTVWEIRQLRDDLRSGACHWKKLTKREREEHAKSLNERRQAGEQVRVPRKKRDDAGVPRKRRSMGEDEGNDRRKKTKKKSSSASKKVAQAVIRNAEPAEDESDEEDEE